MARIVPEPCNNPSCPLIETTITRIHRFVQQLLSLDSPARDQALKGFDSVHAPDVALSRELFSPTTPDTGPRVRRLLLLLEQRGVSRARARRECALLLQAIEGSTAAWANWMHVNDREELRLRLEVLAYFETWSSQFDDFVLFFFRASVSDLYQVAAVTLGRQLHRSRRLKEYFVSFLQQRSIEANQPVVLNGKRSARRVLIATAAAHGIDQDTEGLPRPLPAWLDREASSTADLPSHPADVFALLFATELWLEPRRDDPAANRAIDGVLEAVTNLPPARLTRGIAQRFASLLATRGGNEIEKYWAGFYGLLHSRVKAPHGLGFAQREATLALLDELFRSLVHLPPERARSLLRHLERDADGDIARLARLRTRVWHRRDHACDAEWLREHDHPPVTTTATRTTVHSPGEVLDWLENYLQQSNAAKPAEVSFLDSGQSDRAQLSLLAALLEPLESHHRWLAHDEGTRALIAMLLIDQLEHLRVSDEQLAAIMADKGHGIGKREHEDVADAPAQVLLRMLSWEKPGSEELLDVRTIHRAHGEHILLALLPSRQRSESLPVIADTFEHLLRWRLVREKDFSPHAFLLKAAIRRPHSSFFTELGGVCSGRTYRNAAGEPVELERMALAHRGGDFSEDDLAVPPLSLVQSLTRRLTDVASADRDTRTEVHRLCDIIGGNEQSAAQRNQTVVGLLSILYEETEHAFRAGHPALTSAPLGEIVAQVAAIGNRIRTEAGEMLPEEWSHCEEAHESLSAIRLQLKEANRLLGPLLPPRLAEAFDTAIRRVESLATHWLEAIENILAHAPDSLTPSESRENLDALPACLRAIHSIEDPFLQEHFTALFWKALRSSHDEANSTRWEHDLAVLDWALSQNNGPEGTKEVWSKALCALYSELLECAIEENAEADLLHLATGERYKKLRESAECAVVLGVARAWCIDRYHLMVTHRLSRELARAQALGAPSLLRTSGAFFARFGRVWLCLMVGAILMLDFGDGWAAMAEPDIGDIRGITITFLIGLLGAFAYLGWDLRQKSGGRLTSRPLSQGQAGASWLRAGAFTAVCLVFTVAITSFLWFLLSRTDEVVHGVWAIGHITVWSGFALFIGVFFGMIGRRY